MNQDTTPSTLVKLPSSLMYGMAGAATLVIFVVLFMLQVQKNPLRADEVDYFQCMKNVVVLGLPLYYSGEVDIDPNRLIHLSARQLDGRRFDFFRFKPETGVWKETFFALTDGNSRFTYGMWHPPLYIYLGSFVFRLASLSPENSALLRYFNLVFVIGLFVGMLILSKELYPQLYQPVAAAAFVLYSLNTLAVAGSLLIDYNATLGPCIAVWFAAVFLRAQRQRTLHVGVITLTSLSFFVSLGIGVSLLVSTLVYVLVVGYRTRPWHAVASLMVGSVLFVPTFLLLCRVLGLPFSQPFLHNMARWDARADLVWVLAGLKAGIVYGFWYAKALGCALALTAIVLMVRMIVTGQASRNPARVLPPLTVFVGFLLQGSLSADAWGFPKYILFLVPLLMVFVAGEAVSALCGTQPIGAPCRTVIILLLVVTLVAEAAGSVSNLRQPGGTLYLSGQEGVMEIGHELRSLSQPSDVVLSTKDVAFFANRRFVPWSDSLSNDVITLQRRVQQEQIHYIVVSSASLLAASDDVANYLRTEFASQAVEGSFRLLRAPGS